MMQDERWLIRYNEVKTFIEVNHCNPSRHRIEEHDMLNWVKVNKKAMKAGMLKEERTELFDRLMKLSEKYRHINQWK